MALDHEPHRRRNVPKLSCDQTLSQLQQLADAIEQSFAAQHSQLPALGGTPEAALPEYERLAAFFDRPAILEKHPGIIGYDVGFTLLRRDIARQPLFAGFNDSQRQQIFDALLGRIHYDPPPEEYQNRLHCLDALRAAGFEDRLNREIPALVAYLNELNEAARRAFHRGPMTQAKIVDSFANPTSELTSEHLVDLDRRPSTVAQIRSRHANAVAKASAQWDIEDTFSPRS